jgi:hypothetical protein
MYKILKPLKDTYITNKIVSDKFRATDANVGQAGTLDLFKMFAESTLNGSSSLNELSRLLIKFDLAPLQSLTGSILDISHDSFKCTLKLYDVYGGQSCPSNFKMIVYPLSKSFDEGVGMDVKTFSHLDSCNFITSSIQSGTPVLWNSSGSNAFGVLGQSNIDIIASGNLQNGSGVVDLFKTQSFDTGEEDLSIDITTIVSATIAGLLPDHGLRLSFSGTNETDEKTRFVKRFASRHASNVYKRPKILVQYDNSEHDHQESMFFDLTGSIFLRNYHRGQPANILSGTAAVQMSGSECITLKLKSGSFSRILSASQHKIGKNYVTGVYSASFAISSLETSLTGEINSVGSGTFKVYWLSKDMNIAYHTGSIVINEITRSSFDSSPRRLSVTMTNQRSQYRLGDKARIRVHIADMTPVIVKARKTPREKKSIITKEMFYRVIDARTNDVIIPFDTVKRSTNLSSDGKGMFFDLYFDALSKGRSYKIEFLVKERGIDLYFKNTGNVFSVI